MKRTTPFPQSRKIRAFVEQLWSSAHQLVGAAVGRGIDLLVPPTCLVCRTLLGEETGTKDRNVPAGICPSCIRAIFPPWNPCNRCSAMLSMQAETIAVCGDCRSRERYFQEALALGPHEGELRSAIFRVKKREGASLAYHLGLILGNHVAKKPWGPTIEVVCPVASPWLKRLARGAFPAREVARGVAQAIGKPLEVNWIGVRRWPQRQAGLAREERMANVRRAFVVREKHRLRGAKVLLVDDVITSGATIEELSRVLLRAKAAEVYACAIARGGWGS